MTPHGTAARLAAKYGYVQGHDLAMSQAKGAEIAVAIYPAMGVDRAEKLRTKATFWRNVARYVWSAKVTNDIRGMLP